MSSANHLDKWYVQHFDYIFFKLITCIQWKDCKRRHISIKRSNALSVSFVDLFLGISLIFKLFLFSKQINWILFLNKTVLEFNQTSGFFDEKFKTPKFHSEIN